MEKLQHTLEGALETLIGFEETIAEAEGKLASLLKVLETGGLSTETLFDVFRTFSQLRFHLSEAGEYRHLLDGTRKARAKNGVRTESAPPNSPLKVTGPGPAEFGVPLAEQA